MAISNLLMGYYSMIAQFNRKQYSYSVVEPKFMVVLFLNQIFNYFFTRSCINRIHCKIAGNHIKDINLGEIDL